MGTVSSFDEQWKEFTKWWGSPNQSHGIKSIEKSFTEHPLFYTAMTINRSMLSVIDLRTMEILFVTGDSEEITGVDKASALKGGVKLVYEKVHPDDRIVGPLFGQLVAPYFKALPVTQRTYFKSYWDWRTTNRDGAQARVLTQDSILKHDAEGNMVLLLSFITDISNLKSDRCNHLHITNGEENLLYEYNQADKKIYTLECPSDRELDVFRHISQGYQRKQIADKLGISLATVKTHCQHTFEKLRTNDSVETINLLKVIGLL